MKKFHTYLDKARTQGEEPNVHIEETGRDSNIPREISRYEDALSGLHLVLKPLRRCLSNEISADSAVALVEDSMPKRQAGLQKLFRVVNGEEARAQRRHEVLESQSFLFKAKPTAHLSQICYLSNDQPHADLPEVLPRDSLLPVAPGHVENDASWQSVLAKLMEMESILERGSSITAPNTLR